MFTRWAYLAVNINILNGTNGRAVIVGHVQPRIQLHVEAFSGTSELDVDFGVDMYTKVDIDAESSGHPLMDPPPGSSKIRGVDKVTSGWAGVKGGIVLSSASKGSFGGSSEIKKEPFFRKEWDISKVCRLLCYRPLMMLNEYREHSLLRERPLIHQRQRMDTSSRW